MAFPTTTTSTSSTTNTGHFIAPINQLNPPQSGKRREARETAEEKKKAAGAFVAFQPGCMFCGRFLDFCADLLVEKCRLAQTGVASTGAIDWPRFQRGPGGRDASAAAAAAAALEGGCEMKKPSITSEFGIYWPVREHRSLIYLFLAKFLPLLQAAHLYSSEFA